MDIGGTGRRRVLIPQALGGDEFLRVTWHEERDVFVFSHWQGRECVAATPVRVSDLGDLAELIVAALARAVGADVGASWAAPSADGLIATSLTLTA